MKTRRELLIMGGAGAAAVALPSFVSNRDVALARPRTDRMLEELGSQLQRQMMELGGPIPRGDGMRLAATFRMLAAWGSANNLDAQIRKAVADGVALEGRHNFIGKMVAFDRIADLKQRSFPCRRTWGT